MVPHPFPRLPIGHSMRLDAERPGGFVNKHHQDGVSNFSFDHWTYTNSRESMSATEQLPGWPSEPKQPGTPFTQVEGSRRRRRGGRPTCQHHLRLFSPDSWNRGLTRIAWKHFGSAGELERLQAFTGGVTQWPDVLKCSWERPLSLAHLHKAPSAFKVCASGRHIKRGARCSKPTAVSGRHCPRQLDGNHESLICLFVPTSLQTPGSTDCSWKLWEGMRKAGLLPSKTSRDLCLDGPPHARVPLWRTSGSHG